MNNNGRSGNASLWAGASAPPAPPDPPHFLSSSLSMHRPADADEDFGEEEGGIQATRRKPESAEEDDDAPPPPPTQLGAAGSIPHLEATPVEPDEHIKVCRAVPMTPLLPTRWEQHKICIIATFAVLFVALVAVIVSLATQVGGGDDQAQADPSPLFGDCRDRVKERRTYCTGGSAECETFRAGGCFPWEREEPPPVEREWDCSTRNSQTICTFDVTCCRATAPPVVATTATPSLRPTKAASTNPTIPWDAPPATEWVRRGEDLDGDAANDWLGWSVALSSDGTVLAVGAPYNDGAGRDAGHVRVYAWDAPAAEWVRRGEGLSGYAAGDRLGWSVALSSDGTVLAVGVYGNAGHVRVYAWDAPAAKWARRGEGLYGEASGDKSGWSVALSSDGTVLAVGAVYNDDAGKNAGHVRVYAWDAPAAKWVRRGEDLNGEGAGDRSGYSVALSSDGTVLTIGAVYNDDAGRDSGHVRVYAWDALVAEWVRRGEDLNGEAAGDMSGYSVALSSDGTVLAVGAVYNHNAQRYAGHVRVYAWDALVAEWVRRGEDLDGEAAGGLSGSSVALSSNGTVLAVGAPSNDGAGNNVGHVRVYTWDVPTAEWVRRGEDLDGEAAGGWSGSSVALSSNGTVLAVGAPGKTPASNYANDYAGHVSVHAWQAVNKT